MAPTVMKAVVTTGDGKVQLRSDVPVPKYKSTEVLVKVVAVGENPVDPFVASMSKEPGNIVGHDFAGIVEEIGADVRPGTRKIGERVTGSVHGTTYKDKGAFAEYLVVDAEKVTPLPDSISFPDGATLTVGTNTAFQMLYQSQNLARPSDPVKTPTPILVWSGATTVGQFLIQIAKASGYTIITTASQKNHEYLKSIGADTVFDYKDPDVAKKIREYTDDKLVHGFVCYASGEETNKLVSDSLSSSGAIVSSCVQHFRPTRENISSTMSNAYSLYGAEMTFPFPGPAVPEHSEAHKGYLKILADLLAQGKIKTPEVKIVPGGLSSISEAFELLQSQAVSAQKLVHIVAETP